MVVVYHVTCCIDIITDADAEVPLVHELADMDEREAGATAD